MKAILSYPRVIRDLIDQCDLEKMTPAFVQMDNYTTLCIVSLYKRVHIQQHIIKLSN